MFKGHLAPVGLTQTRRTRTRNFGMASKKTDLAGPNAFDIEGIVATVTGVCPECGEKVTAETAATLRVNPTRDDITLGFFIDHTITACPACSAEISLAWEETCIAQADMPKGITLVTGTLAIHPATDTES